MRKLLAYDDVNIVPKYSELVSRNRVNLNTRFTKTKNIKIPIVSSPMDTITEYDMALEMMDLGGIGVIHRFMSIEEQAGIVKKLKLNKKLWGKFISENVTLENEVDSMFAYAGTIIGSKTKPLEEYTLKEWKFLLDETLDNHPIKLNLSAIRSFYRKVFKLKWGHLVNLDYFDIHKQQIFMDELNEEDERNLLNVLDPTIKVSKIKLKLIKDFYKSMESSKKVISKLPICAAVGVKKDYIERSRELINNGCNVLLIDVAHGHHKLVGDAIEEIKKIISKIEVVAGSVATGEACEYLCEKGADAIRVGIGNGSLCETRIRTGVGIPQVTAIRDCVAVADRFDVPIVGDGGIRNVGDVCKGLACGADSIMLGSLLSGTKETPGEIEKVGKWPNEQLYKKYRGSASLDSKKSRGHNKNVEGNHKVIPYKGKIKRIIKDIQEGIRSSFSYVGANDISEYHAKVELIEVTRAGNLEGKPHLLTT
jgi:IMP dehydrogenase